MNEIDLLVQEERRVEQAMEEVAGEPQTKLEVESAVEAFIRRTGGAGSTERARNCAATGLEHQHPDLPVNDPLRTFVDAQRPSRRRRKRLRWR